MTSHEPRAIPEPRCLKSHFVTASFNVCLPMDGGLPENLDFIKALSSELVEYTTVHSKSLICVHISSHSKTAWSPPEHSAVEPETRPNLSRVLTQPGF